MSCLIAKVNEGVRNFFPTSLNSAFGSLNDFASIPKAQLATTSVVNFAASSFVSSPSFSTASEDSPKYVINLFPTSSTRGNIVFI